MNDLSREKKPENESRAIPRKTSEELLPLVYEELRKLAARNMVRENPGQTLSATALVHEAYQRLVDGENTAKWDDRGHFFAAAAEAMRRILIDSARRKKAIRHGGDQKRVNLDSSALFKDPSAPNRILDILDFNEALKKYEVEYPTKAKLVKLRYFAGLTIKEAAESLKSRSERQNDTGNSPKHGYSNDSNRLLLRKHS